jgi:hypothetical protein
VGVEARGGESKLWVDLLTVVCIVHVVILWMNLGFVALSRPKVPNRVTFFEMQSRAVRLRDVALPAIAAAVLGFFVSLAASYVHSGFAAPIVTMLGLSGTAYVYLLFVGVVVSLAGLLALMDRMRSDARSLARSPASINRAAELLLRGSGVEGLDADDLRRNLERWQARAGREAMRTVLWRKDSPHVNVVLQEVRRGRRRPRRPRRAGRRLLLASFADQRLRGVLVTLGFAVPFAAGIVAVGMILAVPGSSAGEGWRFVFPILQVLGGLLFVRFNARFVILCWRIEEIELRAAKRRIARLVPASAHCATRRQDGC